MKKRITVLLDEVRKNVPLVHNITNYVTVNDCANAILAIGGSPIMADDILEASDITSISNALVLNIGTLNQRTITSMIASGKRANEQNIPVVFDPVGAGASKYRNDTVKEILSQVKISIIRGNLSEMSYIAGQSSSTKGVDSAESDNKNDSVKVAKTVAKKYNCIAAITGVVDVVTDGTKVIKISNGTKALSKVTGTGCMTSAITGAFAGAAKMIKSDDYLAAAVVAIVTMGISGEIAYEKAGNNGTGSFHVAIIDAISNMNDSILNERIKIDEA